LSRERWDDGARLEYDLTGVVPARHGRGVFEVERFVGGGFAGQVYRVRLLELQCEEGPLAGLEPGGTYAVKVLVPPSGLSRAFRDVLFKLGYQGPFIAACHPAAVRTGVLWQKLIRRAAASHLGSESAVCDTHATFYDPELRAFGEVNEWLEGRTWKYEVDDRLFERWRFDGTPPPDHPSAEYVHKRLFMRDLVRMLHEMGAGELARQYEWWTTKSQPNVLKRSSQDADAAAGLTAVDFRAGLTLLPFLPMSPADLWLILRGVLSGRLVQFDRSEPVKLACYLDEQPEGVWSDLQGAVTELKECEPVHRASLPDVTWQGLRLLTDGGLRASVRRGTASAWRHLGRLDEAHERRLADGGLLFWLLLAVSFVPLLGRRLIKLWGHGPTRAHLGACLARRGYLKRAWRGTQAETLIGWHRDERVGDEGARRLLERPVRFWLQRVTLGWLPASWHRTVAEPSWAWGELKERLAFLRDFLRDPAFREQWLLDEVEAGREEGMLTDEEADRVADQVQDPFIQKYLRCLAVHLCTVPVTQVVMVLVGLGVGAWVYIVHQAGWDAAVLAGAGAGALIQLLPISPGSTARGVFVLYLMIRERDWRNYYIAAPVSFIHVLGYLAFPLQMVAHNPSLARFMAGRWATRLTNHVPVFGERGGLLEHMVFDTFFNLPLTIKRSYALRPVYWTLLVLLLAAIVASAVWSVWLRFASVGG